MGKDERRERVGRRGLLRGIGLTAGGAVAGAVAAASAVGGAEDAAKESPDEQAKARYRESEEVKRFYALNRL